MASDFVIDASGLNPVLGDYRIVDVRERSNAYDVWTEYLCLSPTVMPTLSTCVFEALAEPPDDWFDEDGEVVPKRRLDGKLFPPAYFEGQPVSQVESFVCGPLVVSPDGDVAAFGLPEESQITEALNALKWPSSSSLCERIAKAAVTKIGSPLSRELVNSYLATRYLVDEGGASVELRVGERCDGLLPFLPQQKSAGAAFITAWNPQGQPLDDNLNHRRNALLKADLDSLAGTVLAGQGIGPDESWPPEESFLALGLTIEQAIHVGNHYAQNAIVWAAEDCVPKLLLLR